MAIRCRDCGGRGVSLVKKKTATERALERAKGEKLEAQVGQLKASLALGKVAPRCPRCDSMLGIFCWNGERLMCICNNMTCDMWHNPVPDLSAQELLSCGLGP